MPIAIHRIQRRASAPRASQPLPAYRVHPDPFTDVVCRRCLGQRPDRALRSAVWGSLPHSDEASDARHIDDRPAARRGHQEKLRACCTRVLDLATLGSQGQHRGKATVYLATLGRCHRHAASASRSPSGAVVPDVRRHRHGTGERVDDPGRARVDFIAPGPRPSRGQVQCRGASGRGGHEGSSEKVYAKSCGRHTRRLSLGGCAPL